MLNTRDCLIKVSIDKLKLHFKSCRGGPDVVASDNQTAKDGEVTGLVDQTIEKILTGHPSSEQVDDSMNVPKEFHCIFGHNSSP